MVSYKEAINIALQSAQKRKKSEVVTIEEALYRVLSEDIYAVRDLPPFNNSAMDGYVFSYSQKEKKLKIIDTILAGDHKERRVNDGECYKIMTGAKVPESCDRVIPVELAAIEGDYLIVNQDIKEGNAVRLKGEELRKGERILKAGELLSPAKIALLASQGIVKVSVFKKLTVAIASTGNELKEPHEEAREGEIYNINAINIKMHLKALGFDADYLGSIPDDLEGSIKFIEQFKQYDVAITTGGVSKGDADYTEKAFLVNGLNELFKGIKVKPGHPTLFGMMEHTFVMAMPGNPLAAIVNILLLGVPVLCKLQGREEMFYKTCRVRMAKELRLKPGRANIVLGNLKDGSFYPYKNNKYGSGMISPLAQSDAIVLFGEDKSFIEEKSEIEAVLLNQIHFTQHLKYIN